jgi:hypothetical protein
MLSLSLVGFGSALSGIRPSQILKPKPKTIGCATTQMKSSKLAGRASNKFKKRKQ